VLLLEEVQQVGGRPIRCRRFTESRTTSILRCTGMATIPRTRAASHEGVIGADRSLSLAQAPMGETGKNGREGSVVKSTEPEIVEQPLVVAPVGLHLDVKVEIHPRREEGFEFVARLGPDAA